MRPAPPRIDETGLIKVLKDLFDSWRLSLKESFKGLTAAGGNRPPAVARPAQELRRITSTASVKLRTVKSGASRNSSA